MELLAGVLRFINVFTAAVVGAGQIYVLLVLVPTLRRFETRTSVEVHNAMLGHQTDYFMKPAGIISGLTGIAILYLQLRYQDLALSTVFMGIGLLGTLGVVITSQFFNVPTNITMKKWSLDAIPADYPKVRQWWDQIHTIRTCCGVSAFTCYLIATILTNARPPVG